MEIKSARMMSPDGEWVDLDIINTNTNDTIAPIYSVNPVPTISILDTVHDTIQQELRKEWRREMNKMLWKMGAKNK